MQGVTRQRGFGLIELMVALTIAALLLAAAMPSISGWLDNTRIRNAADSLSTGLQTARAEAVKRNENVSFWLVQLTDPAALDNDCTLSSTSGSWVVSVSTPDSHCADDPTKSGEDNSAGIVAGRAIGSAGTHVTVSADSTYVTFNGFGRVTASGGISQIDVKGSGSGTYRPLRVVVSAVGAVRMCDPAVNSSSDPRKC